MSADTHRLAHVVDNLHVLGVSDEGRGIHRDVVVQRRHHVCNTKSRCIGKDISICPSTLKSSLKFTTFAQEVFLSTIPCPTPGSHQLHNLYARHFHLALVLESKTRFSRTIQLHVNRKQAAPWTTLQ